MFPLALEAGAARFDAIAARRTGASWQEPHKVVELLNFIAAFALINNK